jgi:hypothetical protein
MDNVQNCDSFFGMYDLKMTEPLKFNYSEAEHYSRGHQLSTVSRLFLEPVGSIPNSQELSTCPYPEPDHPIPPLQDPS